MSLIGVDSRNICLGQIGSRSKMLGSYYATFILVSPSPRSITFRAWYTGLYVVIGERRILQKGPSLIVEPFCSLLLHTMKFEGLQNLLYNLH